MNYEITENWVADSFNRLITSISKRGDKSIIKQTIDHTNKLEQLLQHFKKREANMDFLIFELFFLRSRVKKATVILRMFISNIYLDDISNDDLYELNRMRRGKLYTAKSFIEANDAMADKNLLKSFGFRFKGDLSLEDLKARIIECNQKLISKHENTTKG